MSIVLLSGYYGYGNTGDEAVLDGLLAGLREALPAVHPVVLSGDPATTRALHHVEAVPRSGWVSLRRALSKADVLVSGGGSLLQDVTSWRSPLYYLGVIALAQRMHVPVAFLAQGVGPLNRPLIRRLTRRVLDRVKAISVRDKESEALLQQIGVTRPPVTLTADAAFLMPPRTSEQLDNWWAKNIPVGAPVLGVALRPWGGAASNAQWKGVQESLEKFTRATGALVVYLPMQPVTDVAVARVVKGAHAGALLDLVTGSDGVYPTRVTTPWEMMEAVKRCDLVLGMRLHSLIFAVAGGVPALGLSYDPKVASFCQEAGLPSPMHFPMNDTEALGPRLLTVWTERVRLSEMLASRWDKLRAAARRNIDVLAEVINKQGLRQS